MEREELITSNRQGVCDSLNCHHCSENISIKIFYNWSSLSLTFLAAKSEGVQESWLIGQLERGMKVKGGKMRKVEKKQLDTDNQTIVAV